MSEADELEQELATHAETCPLGPRLCADCLIRSSGAAVSAIILARAVAMAAREAMGDLDDLCVYCGAPSTARDHLVPKPWSGKAARRWVPTLPACTPCNSSIGDLPDMGISVRAAHVAERLRRHHAKSLAIPDREPGELDDLSERLRSVILARQHARNVVRSRLAVLELGGMPNVPSAWRTALARGAQAYELDRAA